MENLRSKYKRKGMSRKSALPLLYFYPTLLLFGSLSYPFLNTDLNLPSNLPKTFWRIGQEDKKCRARNFEKPAYNRSDSRLLFSYCGVPSPRAISGKPATRSSKRKSILPVFAISKVGLIQSTAGNTLLKQNATYSEQ